MKIQGLMEQDLFSCYSKVRKDIPVVFLYINSFNDKHLKSEDFIECYEKYMELLKINDTAEIFFSNYVIKDWIVIEFENLEKAEEFFCEKDENGRFKWYPSIPDCMELYYNGECIGKNT